MNPTEVLQKTAHFFNISVARMKSESRDAIFCQARRFFVSVVVNDHTRKSIGEYINRDHSTVTNMLQEHIDELNSKPYYNRYREYLKFMELAEPDEVINVEDELKKRDQKWCDFLRTHYGKVLNDTLVQKFFVC